MMTIKREGLLGCWYGYWVKKGGRPLGKDWERNLAKGDLCHFVRAMVIYPPLRWFFLARTKTVIAPWSICLAIAFIVGLYLNPKIPLTIMAVLGAYAVIIAGAVLLATKADDFLKTYIGQPIKKFFGWKIIGRLYFWFLPVAALIALGICYVPEFMLTSAIVIAIMVAFLVAVVIIVGMGIGIGKIFRYQPIQEIGSVVFEYLKAKKAKICPLLLVELN